MIGFGSKLFKIKTDWLKLHKVAFFPLLLNGQFVGESN